MARKTWNGSSGDFSASGNWLPTGAPTSGDDLIFDGTSVNSVTSNLDQTSAGDFGSLVIDDDYTGSFGSGLNYLQIGVAASGLISLAGSGTIRLDLGSSDVDVQVLDGSVYVKGSAIADLIAMGGEVFIAGKTGDSASVTKIKAMGSTIEVSDQVTNSPAVEIYEGKLTTKNTLGSLQTYGGTIETTLDAVVSGAMTIEGGMFIPNGSGSYGAMTLFSGSVDGRKSGSDRTFSSVKINGGGIALNPSITITSFQTPDDQVVISVRKG